MFLFCCYNINGQELLIGDSTIVEAIKKQTSKIYNEKDKTIFILTKRQLRSIKTYGTNIIAHSKNDTINRVVAISMTKKGQLSTEWYFTKNKLIYVYESFEFFEDKKEMSNWKNFKGFCAWESRYYFVDNQMKYQKHQGKNKNNKNNVLKDGRALLNYITQQQNEEK